MYSRWALRESQPHNRRDSLELDETLTQRTPNVICLLQIPMHTLPLLCSYFRIYFPNFPPARRSGKRANCLYATQLHKIFSSLWARELYARRLCGIFFAPPSFRCCNFLCRQYVWRNIKSLWASSAASHRTGDRSIIAKSRCRSGNEIARNAARS